MPVIIAATPLTRWMNFYAVAGESAAALTGLQFVVIALIAQMRMRAADDGIAAFSTPTVVYFSTVLLLATVLCAPWDGLSVVAAFITFCGAVGTVYSAIVGWRTQRVAEYQLVLEDWLSHIALPLIAFAMLLAAGLALVPRPTEALFTIAAATLLLLFIGIHNAWDTVTFLVGRMMKERADAARRDGERQQPPPAEPPPA